MVITNFERLYNTEFFISGVTVKPQYWYVRSNIYNSLSSPKINHTLLWFKNCSATITDSNGEVLEVKQNQITYMAKGLRYKVEFHNTDPSREDTIVIHFQLTDKNGNIVKSSLFAGKTIDVKGVVDYFSGSYQIKVYSLDDITIH